MGLKVDDEIIDKIKDVIISNINAVSDYPEENQFSYLLGEQSLVFTANVNKKDIGKVIGKHGKLISSIRNIMLAQAGKYKTRCVLLLDE